ncbi:hypothetical protein ANCCAN_07540 [Ancylostoma caninum]|uniref:Uncharacterized protein n=1 Tax=Ancylostoma caninum TaxID=29170 RepID=A0A368GPZ8_ANCCA|nr:hypothetical protein ANCCAN_07540 [Ancylostoma caninum]
MAKVTKSAMVYIPVQACIQSFGRLSLRKVSWTHEDNLPFMVANTLKDEWDRSRGFGVDATSRLGIRLDSSAGVQSFQVFNTCYKRGMATNQQRLSLYKRLCADIESDFGLRLEIRKIKNHFDHSKSRALAKRSEDESQFQNSFKSKKEAKIWSYYYRSPLLEGVGSVESLWDFSQPPNPRRSEEPREELDEEVVVGEGRGGPSLLDDEDELGEEEERVGGGLVAGVEAVREGGGRYARNRPRLVRMHNTSPFQWDTRARNLVTIFASSILRPDYGKLDATLARNEQQIAILETMIAHVEEVFVVPHIYGFGPMQRLSFH